VPTRPPTHGKDIQRKRAETRPTSAALRYGSRWQRYAKIFLAQNPLCVKHLGDGRGPEPATLVDHIVPHKGDEQLFWDSDNHQALCASCHGVKTATEDGGFGR